VCLSWQVDTIGGGGLCEEVWGPALTLCQAGVGLHTRLSAIIISFNTDYAESEGR
jgi:hypothetical protein